MQTRKIRASNASVWDLGLFTRAFIVRPKDSLNPYASEVKLLAREIPCDPELNNPRCFDGTSLIGYLGQIEEHHVYPKILFPLSWNMATLKIKVSQKRHVFLHKLLALGKYDAYADEIFKESSGKIDGDVAGILRRRIFQLQLAAIKLAPYNQNILRLILK